MALALSVVLVSWAIAQEDGRRIVVVSDLHLGAGRTASGAWDGREDFRWDAEFTAFLDALAGETGVATDLVLNGDTFELWESAEPDCQAPDAGCAEGEALARLERVLAAHESTVAGLARFAASGGNRVVLVPGDHDAALLWPAVGARARQALAAAGGRVEVVSEGYWLSPDGQVYVEHGHQVGRDAARYAAWPRPFVTRDDVERLERTFAERVAFSFFAAHEPTYPLLDNIVEQGRGLRYGLAIEGFPDDRGRLADLFRYFVLKLTWQQFRTNLESEQKPPAWDVPAVREQGDRFLLETLPADDPLRPVIEAALAEGPLAFGLDDLTDADIVAICDYRASVRRSRRRLEQTLTQLGPIAGPPLRECARDPATRGAVFGYFFRGRDTTYREHVEEVVDRLREAGRLDGPFAVLIEGHSHLPSREFSPTGSGFRVFNTGAWQRVITPAAFEAMAEERGLEHRAALEAWQPEELEPCYPFVAVPPYQREPDPELGSWRREADEWTFGQGC